MIEFVFVHGVATRPGPSYQSMVANRDQLLRSVLFAGNPVTIASPMWGVHAGNLDWGGAAFQRVSDNVGSLSLGTGLGSGMGFGMEDPGEGQDGATLAKTSVTDPAAAIDELFATMVAMADAEGRVLTNEELAEFRAAAVFLASGGSVATSDDMSDSAFVDALRSDMGIEGSFGLVDSLKAAATRVTGLARNSVGKGLVALFRDQLNPAVATFLGDIFAYLKSGPMRDAIRSTIVADLTAAHDRASAEGSRLILMGHSLGGVILYDLLSSPALAKLPDGFKADALITVGSQPGLFEELELFDHKASPRGVPNKVSGPERADCWLNVFDPIDLFGFKAAPIFSAAEDFEFDSGTGLTSAHTSYFARPQFHARLRKRLGDRGLIAT